MAVAMFEDHEWRLRPADEPRQERDGLRAGPGSEPTSIGGREDECRTVTSGVLEGAPEQALPGGDRRPAHAASRSATGRFSYPRIRGGRRTAARGGGELG